MQSRLNSFRRFFFDRKYVKKTLKVKRIKLVQTLSTLSKQNQSKINIFARL